MTTAIAMATSEPSAPLDLVLAAWSRYADLRAEDAPLSERLAAWSALQDARRRSRTAARG